MHGPLPELEDVRVLLKLQRGHSIPPKFHIGTRHSQSHGVKTLAKFCRLTLPSQLAPLAAAQTTLVFSLAWSGPIHAALVFTLCFAGCEASYGSASATQLNSFIGTKNRII
jgi:hypothetical protein